VTFDSGPAGVPVDVPLDRSVRDPLAGADAGWARAARLAGRGRGTARASTLETLQEGIEVDRPRWWRSWTST
jgi:hypothetical protein